MRISAALFSSDSVLCPVTTMGRPLAQNNVDDWFRFASAPIKFQPVTQHNNLKLRKAAIFIQRR